MTFRQLAQLAGVSASTVSKALAGSKEISAATSERIRRLAQENGIGRPRYNRVNTSSSIAVLTPEIISRFCSQTINLISAALLKHGIIPTVYVCGFDHNQYSKMLETVCVEGHIGIISLYDDYRSLPKREIPFLHFSYSKMIYGAFSSDNGRSGISQAVDHLVSLGHTEIGYVGKKDSATELNGFKDILKKYGLNLNSEWFYTSKDYFRFDGNEAVHHFLRLKTCPTALISSNDEVAINLIHDFKKAGIKIPEYISIIGVGNTLCSSCIRNTLTTVEITINDTIMMMVNMFINDIKSKKTVNAPKYIEPTSKLIVRESTTKPRSFS